MQASEAHRPVGSVKRCKSTSDSEDEEACWICLSAAGNLTRPCDCPRLCHRECIATWQLTNYGRREENFCRFCNKRLPALWKPDITQDASEELRVAPVMAVRYNGSEGTREFKLRVKPGPEGLAMFKAHLKEILGFDVGSEFDVTFECQMPATGSMLTLSGLNAYGAATHCAALLAASKTGTATSAPSGPSSQPQSRQPASSSFTGLGALTSAGTNGPLPRASPASTAVGLARQPLPSTTHPSQPQQSAPPMHLHQHQQPPAISLPALTTQRWSSRTPRSPGPLRTRRLCQTGYVHSYLLPARAAGRRSGSPPTTLLSAAANPRARAVSAVTGGSGSSSGDASWPCSGGDGARNPSSVPKATWAPQMRASSDSAARSTHSQGDDIGSLREEEYDIDDLLPYSRRDLVPEPPSVMPPVGAAASAETEQDCTGASLADLWPYRPQPPRQQPEQAGGPTRPRPRSSPNGTAGFVTQALPLNTSAMTSVGDAAASPQDGANARRNAALAARRSPAAPDRSAVSPSSGDRCAGLFPPAAPRSAAAGGLYSGSGAGADMGAGATAAIVAAPQSRHRPEVDGCGLQEREQGPVHGRLRLPEVIRSTAKRTVSSLLKALRNATK